jgi:hypothetical protein
MLDNENRGRGKQKLTPHQQELLERVSRVDGRWRDAKRTAMLEAKRIVQERIDAHAALREQAVWEALEAGIPKSRIGREGLGTSSPNAVYEIEERMRFRMGVRGEGEEE